MLDLSTMTPVGPELSGLSCACGYGFTRVEAGGLHKISACPKCGAEIHREELELNPTAEAMRMLDDAAVKATTWYHITRRRDWHASVIEAQATIHIGTKAAALQRAYGLRSGKLFTSMWWLQEVEIAKNASFLPGFAEDDAKGNPVLDLDELEEFAGEHDGFRYLNLYEDAGSASLLIDPSFVQIVSTTAINHADVRRHLHDELAASGS